MTVSAPVIPRAGVGLPMAPFSPQPPRGIGERDATGHFPTQYESLRNAVPISPLSPPSLPSADLFPELEPLFNPLGMPSLPEPSSAFYGPGRGGITGGAPSGNPPFEGGLTPGVSYAVTYRRTTSWFDLAGENTSSYTSGDIETTAIGPIGGMRFSFEGSGLNGLPTQAIVEISAGGNWETVTTLTLGVSGQEWDAGGCSIWIEEVSRVDGLPDTGEDSRRTGLPDPTRAGEAPSPTIGNRPLPVPLLEPTTSPGTPLTLPPLLDPTPKPPTDDKRYYPPEIFPGTSPQPSPDKSVPPLEEPDAYPWPYPKPDKEPVAVVQPPVTQILVVPEFVPTDSLTPGDILELLPDPLPVKPATLPSECLCILPIQREGTKTRNKIDELLDGLNGGDSISTYTAYCDTSGSAPAPAIQTSTAESLAQAMEFISQQIAELRLSVGVCAVTPPANENPILLSQQTAAEGSSQKYVPIADEVRQVELIITGSLPNSFRLYESDLDGEQMGKFGSLALSYPGVTGGYAPDAFHQWAWTRRTILNVGVPIRTPRYVRVYVRPQLSWILYDTGLRY